MPRTRCFRVSIDKLVISPIYFRWMIDEKHVNRLAESIAKYGLKVPLLVKKLHDKKYEIIDGVHRYLALKQLNVNTAKVTLTDMDYLEALKYVNDVLQNTKRFNIVDRMHQIVTLSKHYKKTPSEIAKLLGISTKTVERYLLIWKYTTDEEKRKIIEGKLSVRRALIIAQERKEGKKRKHLCTLCNEFVDRVKPVYMCVNHAELVYKLGNLLKLLPSHEDTIRVLDLFENVVSELREQNVLDEKYERVIRFLTELILTLYKR